MKKKITFPDWTRTAAVTITRGDREKPRAVWGEYTQDPAVYAGITYQKITALIYRKAGQGKNIQVSAELLDRNGRAVVIAPVEKIERRTGNA